MIMAVIYYCLERKHYKFLKSCTNNSSDFEINNPLFSAPPSMQHENSILPGRYTQTIQIISLTTNLIKKHYIPIKIQITHPESPHRLKNESVPSHPTKTFNESKKYAKNG